jgi:DNA-binding transcriptional regulator YdaS (Cro superfamily)
LASLIGSAASAPSMWRKRGAVPAEQAPNIERAVGGKVPVERLCPTAKYVRVPDPDWPHPDGKPLLDTTRDQLPQEA